MNNDLESILQRWKRGMKSESGFSFAMASQLFCMVDKEILPSKKIATFTEAPFMVKLDF